MNQEWQECTLLIHPKNLLPQWLGVVRMKLRNIFLIFFILSILVIAGCTNSNPNGKKITVYKSSSCGCCDLYTGYLEKKGFDVEIINLPDVSAIKTQHGVLNNLQSCHTSVIGDYFVEGHIPTEAIDKLLNEKPNIKGIALPGMPSGSPGMPGSKTGEFVIYSVNLDGTSSEFMRL